MSKKRIILLIGLYVAGLCGCRQTNMSSSVTIEESSQENQSSIQSYAGGVFNNGISQYIENGNGCYLTKDCDVKYYDEMFNEQVVEPATNLYFVDYSTKYEMPLCNNAECEHDTFDCIANIKNFDKNTICVSGDYIYYLAYEDVYSEEDMKLVERYKKGEKKEQLGESKVQYFEDTYLWRIKKDGTTRDRLTKMISVMNTYEFFSEEEKVNLKDVNAKENVVFSNVSVYENKLYLTYYVGGNVRLIEYDIASGKVSEIWSQEKEGKAKLINKLSEGYLWMQIQYLSGGKYTADIYAYSISLGEVKTIATDIKDARGKGMGADGYRMYYSSENKMWTLTYDDTNIKVLREYEDNTKTYYSPMPWKEYLFVNRMDCIEVYDREANKINVIQFDLFDVSKGGEMMQPYFILIGFDNSDEGIVYYDDGEVTNNTYYKFNINDALKGKVVYTAVNE